MSDYQILEQGCLKEGSREEALKYWNAYKKHGTNQPTPIDVIFDYFENKKTINLDTLGENEKILINNIKELESILDRTKEVISTRHSLRTRKITLEELEHKLLSLAIDVRQAIKGEEIV